MLLFALAANDAGLRCVPLGADLPLSELAPAALRAGCRAIVISSSIDPAPETLRQTLPELVALARVPVFVGGQTSVRHRDDLVRAGAIPLGTDLQAGVRLLSSTLKLEGKV